MMSKLINPDTIECLLKFPLATHKIDSDGLLQCKMQQAADQFPYLRSTFDLVVDFGAFGFKPILDYFNYIDIREHVEAVQFLLKDDNSTFWALKVDKGWVDDESFF